MDSFHCGGQGNSKKKRAVELQEDGDVPKEKKRKNEEGGHVLQ